MKKTTLILFLVSFLGYVPFALSQDYTFKVLVNKGKNEMKSGNAWIPVKVGASLKAADELKVAENAYIGLVHSSGKPLEVKQSGKYKVSELAAKISTGSNVLNKYTDFILSTNTSQKGLAATGAVHRGTSMIEVYLPKAIYGNVFSNDVIISWDAEEEQVPYEVVLTSMFGDELKKIQSSEGSVSINIDDKSFAGEDNIIVQVFSKTDRSKASDKFTIKKLPKAERSRVATQYDEVIKQTSEETALNKLIHAGFFEENKLLIDANSAFIHAIKLAPDVQDYKDAHNAFLIRNEMKQLPTKK
jgi:hypothetical protein